MKKPSRRSVVLGWAVGTIMSSGQVMAHHSFAMFDRNREEVLSGTVARWAFNSPHVALYIRSDADNEVWAFEGAAPAALISRNVTGYTFQPGDAVTVVVCPLRDGRRGGAIGYVIKQGDEGDFDAWFRPNDGGCGPSRNWGEWLAAGYRSKAEAEAALGTAAAPAAAP